MNRSFAIAAVVPLALFAAATSDAVAQPGQPGFCGFSVISPFVRARQPQEQSRVRFVSQPDSPVVISSVMFPSLLLPRPANFTPGARLPYSLAVTNVSDRFVRSIHLYLQLRTKTGFAAVAPKISQPLRPTQLVSVRREDSLGDSLASVDLADVHILVAVESVEFDECVFRPSQAAQVFEK